MDSSQFWIPYFQVEYLNHVDKMKACWKFSRVPFQVAPMVSARLACRTTPKHSTSKRRLLQSGLWSFGHSEISSGTSGSKRACELPISSPLSHGAARNTKSCKIMSWSELMVFFKAIHCTNSSNTCHISSIPVKGGTSRPICCVSQLLDPLKVPWSGIANPKD